MEYPSPSLPQSLPSVAGVSASQRSHATTTGSIYTWQKLMPWLTVACLLILAMIGHWRFYPLMDSYELVIMWSIPFAGYFLVRQWPALGIFTLVTLALSGISALLYGQDFAQANQRFFLKYFLNSAVAVLWMCTLNLVAQIAYLLGLRFNNAYRVGRALLWMVALFASVAMLNRWQESYLVGHGFGHIPVSSLYEVFILFALLTTLFYLYFEAREKIEWLGAYIVFLILSANAFLLWYALARDAAAILPLVPALESWWMKIHVPANFVGYSMFGMSAMLGVAYLVMHNANPARQALIESLMYRTIAIGFAFFTVATVLGALWAAEAWGGYWSWDPKEVWALIVWLNYAAWLHFRLSYKTAQKTLAWWSVIGLLITTFAFLGVNIFLSGLHSYGQL